MPEINFTIPGIQKLLEGFKEHKATGPDKISPKVLKQLAKSIASILALNLESHMIQGQCHGILDWQKANVVPVQKKGKKSMASNYRPISLTCIVCKIMKHVIVSNKMSHAASNSTLYNLQHRFRDNCSCETQLLEFQEDVLKNLKGGKQTDVLIMDFSNAFDKVSHLRLLENLKYYGIRGKTNAWISSFLMNRKQTVLLDGVYS